MTTHVPASTHHERTQQVHPPPSAANNTAPITIASASTNQWGSPWAVTRVTLHNYGVHYRTYLIHAYVDQGFCDRNVLTCRMHSHTPGNPATAPRIARPHKRGSFVSPSNRCLSSRLNAGPSASASSKLGFSTSGFHDLTANNISQFSSFSLRFGRVLRSHAYDVSSHDVARVVATSLALHAQPTVCIVLFGDQTIAQEGV